MNILIAPDSFKGSLSALQFCQVAAQQIQPLCATANLLLQPLADGGEGSIDAILNNTAGTRINVQVSDPLGRIIDSQYAILKAQNTAVIEVAQASGLPLLETALRDPLKASSFGAGQLILHALDNGCRRFIICLGGSATNDGGMGMLQALGVCFLDSFQQELMANGETLSRIASIDLSGFDPRIAAGKFIIAGDVINPLLGETGATMTYGPQKGAIAQTLLQLETGMLNFAEKTLSVISNSDNLVEYPGAGAAGGMGFALLAYCQASMQSGFEVIAQLSGFSGIFSDNEKKPDLIISGEGCFDRQSLSGKLLGRMMLYAEQAAIPLVILCGCLGDDITENELSPNVTVFSIQNDLIEMNISINESMENTETLLAKLIKQNAHKFLYQS